MNFAITFVSIIGIFGALIVYTSMKRDGEWKRFMDNNRKQPTDQELKADVKHID